MGKDKITLKREKRKRQKERRRKLKKNLQNTSSTTDQGPKMVQTLASKNSVKASIPKVVIFKDKEGQHEARVALALKLGAKPQKKICKPYAEYKMEVQSRKEEIRKQKELDRMTGMKKVSARPLSTKKSNAKNGKDLNNTKETKSKQNEKTPMKMGKFDGGTLRISQKEVTKMRK